MLGYDVPRLVLLDEVDLAAARACGIMTCHTALVPCIILHICRAFLKFLLSLADAGIVCLELIAYIFWRQFVMRGSGMTNLLISVGQTLRVGEFTLNFLV